VYGDGSNIRDWLYVEDHCRGIELVLESGKIGETYNIGGNNEWGNLAIVERLCDSLDARFARDPLLAKRFPSAPGASGGSARQLITFVEDRAGHDWRYAIDAGKIHRELGWRPRFSFEAALAETVDWYLANPEWIESVRSGAYRNWIATHYRGAPARRPGSGDGSNRP
jgi:dTDP-glucose 4,6-dehydratase